MDNLRALLSYLLSFRRRQGSWQFADYPVRVKRQSRDLTRPDMPPFSAQIINWWTLFGLGESPQAAIDDLRQRFEEYRQEHDTMPRPGSRIPIEFADSSVVAANPELYQKFITEVLGFGSEDPVFISDQSSLFDFEGVNEGINLFERTREIFGVEVSDVTDGNIAAILTRIQDTNPPG